MKCLHILFLLVVFVSASSASRAQRLFSKNDDDTCVKYCPPGASCHRECGPFNCELICNPPWPN